jgi:alpha-glucosidase
MPWSGEPGGGFTTGVPWLRLGVDTARRNVRAERADPDSVLSCYRRLIAARKASQSLQVGPLTLLAPAHPTVVAYRRGAGPDAVVVAINTSPGVAEVRVDDLVPDGVLAPIVGTHLDLPPPTGPGGVVALRPFEACLFEPGSG